MKPSEFYETQRFNQWWLWLINALAIAAMLYSSRTVLEHGDTGEIIAFAVGLLVVVAVLAAFMLIPLRTRITEDGVQVGFRPLTDRFIPRELIREAYVREYSPIGEYGGWGYRKTFGKRGVAYNVRGNQGLQLVLADGKKVLIGTQQPEKLRLFLANHDLTRN